MSLDAPKIPERNDAVSALESKLERLEESLVDIETSMVNQMGQGAESGQKVSYADDQLEARENLFRAIKATREALAQQRRAGFKVVQ